MIDDDAAYRDPMPSATVDATGMGPVYSEFDFTAQDFNRVRELARDKTGIFLAEHKSQLVYSRLARRLRALQISDFSAYLALLDAAPGHAEWQNFINALTTNLTGFFREAHHFEKLADYLRQRDTSPAIWCCAASTGEEPYSIAMTLLEMLGEKALGTRILATDIDTEALATARRGIYPLGALSKIDDTRRKRFFLRGNRDSAGLARIRPEVADMVEFRTLNLTADDWSLSTRFDVVFCRNLIIYFDLEAQKRVIQRLAEVVRPDGLLFAGHSENLSRITDAFQPLGKTVYARRSNSVLDWPLGSLSTGIGR